MKKLLFVILSVLFVSQAHSQITVPEEKRKFSLDFNASAGDIRGLTLELNGRMDLNKGRSIYLGIGGNQTFNKYARLGFMQNVMTRGKWSLDVGAGLKLAHYDYRLIGQGILRELSFETPIEANYKVSESLSLQFGIRPSFTITKTPNIWDSNGVGTAKILKGANIGVKYSFGKNNK